MKYRGYLQSPVSNLWGAFAIFFATSFGHVFYTLSSLGIKKSHRNLRQIFKSLLCRHPLIIIFLAQLGLLCSSFCDNVPVEPRQYKVGLCIVATGKYDQFAQSLIDSGRRYFCKNHKVTFFVFSDGNITEADDVVRVKQERLGWPFDTLKRTHIYEKHQDIFKDMDFLFAVDADMLFVAPVGDEVLGDLVGTQHPAFLGKRGTYEQNKASKAYVGKSEGKFYFCGGFYGGKKKEFQKLIHRLNEQVNTDLKQGVIAKWHDESHLNRYFIDHPPAVVLSPAYCYPESWHLPFTKKLVALDKNHEEMRK